MSTSKVYTKLVLVMCLLVAFIAKGESNSWLSPESNVCSLLESKFVATAPWTTYPIIYEPINRGRLTVWSGVSTLPSSEFRCLVTQNATNDIIMEFASSATRLEWTFYDMSRGLTHYGTSVNHSEDMKYKIHLKNRQQDSYLDCNHVANIENTNAIDVSTPHIISSCNDCSHSLIPLINNQIQDLIKLKLNDQILDNLYWHLTQLLTNQHFSGPLSLKNNSD